MVGQKYLMPPPEILEAGVPELTFYMKLSKSGFQVANLRMWHSIPRPSLQQPPILFLRPLLAVHSPSVLHTQPCGSAWTLKPLTLS